MSPSPAGRLPLHALPPAVDGFALMALARAAQLRGTMEQVLAMSLRHAQERTQFGRPLARFQAIQHHLAEMAGEAAASGAAVDAAAEAGTPFACAAAKARASQAAGSVARLAHQVHGAIGYTAEHDLHHWTTRLWAWRDECGNEAHWWQMLGTHAARGGGAAALADDCGGRRQCGKRGRCPVSDEIRLEVADRVATVTLNRPERRNAFTRSMIDAWAAALADCRAREDVHVVVVTGAGKAFCSGGDIQELMGEGLARSAAEQRALIGEHVHRIPLTLADTDKPVIAAINGAAIGAGLDLALAMDLRFAAASARFAETYVKVGLAPGAGGAHWLPRLVGTAKALELLWTGDAIDAAEAARIGLVNGVWPDEALMERTMDYARRLADGPTLAVRAIKRLVRDGAGGDLRAGLDRAAATYGVLGGSADHREAVEAFIAKRPPRFRGE